MTPEDITEQMLRTRHARWMCEWIEADLAVLLEDACGTEAEFRERCIEDLDTSWRNIHRRARKARENPPESRSPEYSYRSHPLLKRWAQEGHR